MNRDMTIRYIGNFPPPYGGVTIKNKLLYEELSEKIEITQLKRRKFFPSSLYQAINMILALVPGQCLIIGISSMGGKSLLITKLLYKCNRRTMQRSVYFMMGGTETTRIASHSDEIQWYSCYKRIYVETPSMQRTLEKAGLKNVAYFPNCRKRTAILQQNVVEANKNRRLQCVFFSLIQEMKGVDLILKAAERLPEVDFIFYGEIDTGYKETFNNTIVQLSNTEYRGVFKGSDDEKYEELRRYDILLFPTKWKTEGVPGILVEGKIAGLPAVVSDVSYNAELVQDEVNGLVMKENTVDALVDAIKRLDKNRENLEMLAHNCLQSAKKFYIDNYIDEIVADLMGGGVQSPNDIRKIQVCLIAAL